MKLCGIDSTLPHLEGLTATLIGRLMDSRLRLVRSLQFALLKEVMCVSALTSAPSGDRSTTELDSLFPRNVKMKEISM